MMRWMILFLGLCWLAQPSMRPLADDPPQDARESKIRGALDGNRDASSSDPLLDGVLDVIRQQGSILDGSLLDHSLRETQTGDDKPTDSADDGKISDEDAILAESLLRAARLLQRRATTLNSQRINDLVRDLRIEAASILTKR